MQEIERKFIIDFNEIDYFESLGQTYLIEQMYLFVNDKKELRVRKQTTKNNNTVQCFLTYKEGQGLIREEERYQISTSVYDLFIQKNNFKPIKKERTTLTLDTNLEGIYDRYLNLSKNLEILEIEFNTVANSKLFNKKKYDWIKREVTNDPDYKNKNLWLKLIR